MEKPKRYMATILEFGEKYIILDLGDSAQGKISLAEFKGYDIPLTGIHAGDVIDVFEKHKNKDGIMTMTLVHRKRGEFYGSSLLERSASGRRFIRFLMPEDDLGIQLLENGFPIYSDVKMRDYIKIHEKLNDEQFDEDARDILAGLFRSEPDVLAQLIAYCQDPECKPDIYCARILVNSKIIDADGNINDTAKTALAFLA